MVRSFLQERIPSTQQPPLDPRASRGLIRMKEKLSSLLHSSFPIGAILRCCCYSAYNIFCCSRSEYTRCAPNWLSCLPLYQTDFMKRELCLFSEIFVCPFSVSFSDPCFLFLFFVWCFSPSFRFSIVRIKHDAVKWWFPRIAIIDFTGSLLMGAVVCVLSTRYPTACNNTFLVLYWRYKPAHLVYTRENKCARVKCARMHVGLHLEN